MWDWVIDLRGIDAVFFGCAAIGGSIFLLRILMLFVGLGGHGDVDHDFDSMELEHDLGAGVLSVTTLTGFFTVFGVTGLVMRMDEGAGPTLAVAVALFAGLGVMLGLAKMLTLIYRMRSSGNIKAVNADGAEGSVYLTIPVGGRGQVQVPVQSRLKIMDAVAEQPGELKTGTSIRVVRVIEGNVLVVEKA
jgi:hypothetical protein